MSITNSTSILSYISNTYTTYDYTLGGSGIMYSHRKTTVRYTATDKFIIYNGAEFPVFVSDHGRSFIFLMSKNGVEYKKYIK